MAPPKYAAKAVVLNCGVRMEVFEDGEPHPHFPTFGVQRRSENAPTRCDEIAKLVADESRWPQGRAAAGAEAWKEMWAGILLDTRYENPSRSAKGIALARASGSQWFGKLDARELADGGFTFTKKLVGEEECNELCKMMDAEEKGAEMTHEPTSHANVRSVFLTRDAGGKDAKLTSQQAEARDRARVALNECSGMPSEMEPMHELTRAKPGLQSPGEVHSDFKSAPVLMAVTMVSPLGGPSPFFVSLQSDWGLGTPMATAEMRLEEARSARWRRVRAGGSNTADRIPMVGVHGSELGFTSTGNASAHRRKTKFLDPSRWRTGKVRPWMEQGDTIFADATSPHCSPGVCSGEEKLRRTILYTSWVGRRANDGVPGYAFTPEKIGKKKYKKGTEPYFLVFGKDGEFALPRIGKRKGDIDMKNRDAKE